MKNKYLLQLEFRYRHVAEYKNDSGHRFKTITVKICNTREEAVDAGNEVLKVLSKYFEVREDDRLGNRNIVTNFSYQTKGISYFLTINELDSSDLIDTINEVIEASDLYLRSLR